MHQIIQNNLHVIRDLAKQHKAQSLDLFGSAAKGGFDDSRSDFDFLVEFEKLQPGEYFEHFFGLKEDLEKITGRSVDLVVTSAIRNPYFLRQVNATRQPLYIRQ